MKQVKGWRRFQSRIRSDAISARLGGRELQGREKGNPGVHTSPGHEPGTEDRGIDTRIDPMSGKNTPA